LTCPGCRQCARIAWRARSSSRSYALDSDSRLYEPVALDEEEELEGWEVVASEVAALREDFAVADSAPIRIARDAGCAVNPAARASDRVENLEARHFSPAEDRQAPNVYAASPNSAASSPRSSSAPTWTGVIRLRTRSIA
jgi:hypothetical protein